MPIAYLASPDAARLFWVPLLFVNPGVAAVTGRARRTSGERRPRRERIAVEWRRRDSNPRLQS
ncbi:MAG TPA: hypothetical protein VK920_01680 [Solirubrobacterales bacterium]|nr:hypothetical protein [Solirubrobacterales bacterium]